MALEDTQAEYTQPVSYLDFYIVATNSPVAFKIAPRSDFRAEVLSMIAEAGFDPVIADRVINCESGFNAQAHNWNDPNGGSHGIWQINGIHNLSIEEMLDPVISTEYAIKLLKSPRGFNHWTCYEMSTP